LRFEGGYFPAMSAILKDEADGIHLQDAEQSGIFPFGFGFKGCILPA